MASWGPTDPPEFTDKIKLPTHKEWNKLNDFEKEAKVEGAIENILSDSSK